jgi:hypothetical protein
MRDLGLFMGVMIASAWWSPDAFSQESVASRSNDAACHVVDMRPDLAEPGGAGMLAAACGAHGAPIGPATEFSVSISPSGNVLLLRKYHLQTDVLLISTSIRKTVHIDDLTQGLMRRAGLAPDIAVGNVTFDISSFAMNSTVEVKVGKEIKQLSLESYLVKMNPSK